MTRSDQPRSTLTYLVTKTVTTERMATALAFALGRPNMPTASIERLGKTAWKVRALVRDIDLDAARPYLGDHYGLYTHTTN